MVLRIVIVFPPYAVAIKLLFSVYGHKQIKRYSRIGVGILSALFQLVSALKLILDQLYFWTLSNSFFFCEEVSVDILFTLVVVPCGSPDLLRVARSHSGFPIVRQSPAAP